MYWDSIGVAFEMMKKGYTVYGACTLLMFVVVDGSWFLALRLLSQPLPWQMGHRPPAPPLPNWSLIVFIGLRIVFNLFLIGLVSLGAAQLRDGKIDLNSLFAPLSRLAAALLAATVLLLPELPQTLMPYLPSAHGAQESFARLGTETLLTLGGDWVLYGPFLLAATAAVLTNRGVFGAFIETFRRLRWKALMLCVVAAVANLVAQLGLIACLVGELFTFSIVTNVAAVHYLAYFPLTETYRSDSP